MSISSSRAAKFQHVILTRFNVRFDLDTSAAPLGRDPSWLADRFVLFERYCLPSVLAQTEQNFSWLVFFDRETPEPYLSKARALGELSPNILPILCDTLSPEETLDTIRTALKTDTEWLLTTRLDNDDGLHRDFVRTVQSAQTFERTEVLNCRQGFIISDGRGYLRRDESNAFISLSERLPDFRTVNGIGMHVYAGRAYPVRQVAETPMWLQVVHARNLANRVRGWRVEIEAVARDFPAVDLGAGRAWEYPFSILIENLTFSIFRGVRDVLVTIIRNLAITFGLEFRRKVQVTAPSK